jgi:hypothetical protein
LQQLESETHSLFTRFIFKYVDVFLRFANGIAGLLESISSQALSILRISDLLPSSED